jgi:hypothetical protein
MFSNSISFDVVLRPVIFLIYTVFLTWTNILPWNLASLAIMFSIEFLLKGQCHEIVVEIKPGTVD